MVHLNVSVTSFDDVRLQLFVCTFGTRPDICSTCWELTYKLRQKMRGSPKPINMLMALALMKNYERQRKLAAAFGVSTDTFRYYANRFAYAISSLKPAVVSHSSIIRWSCCNLLSWRIHDSLLYSVFASLTYVRRFVGTSASWVRLPPMSILLLLTERTFIGKKTTPNSTLNFVLTKQIGQLIDTTSS